MDSEHRIGISMDDLEFVQISDHEWRVCDVRIPVHDGLRVLGFIEKRDDSYEATLIGQDLERVTSDSLSKISQCFATQIGGDQ